MEKFGVYVLCFLLLIGLAQAEISISEPEDSYSLGEKLYVSVSELRGTDNGNLNIDLICGNSTTNILKISARAFSSTNDQTYAIPYKYLTKQDLEIDNYAPILGTCKLIATLSGDVARSKDFEITKDLILNANLDKLNYNPGDEVTINVNALKINGDDVIGGIRLSNYTTLQENFEKEKTIIINVPNNSPAGEHSLKVHVFETSENSEILNEMNKTLKIIINQIATTVDISVSAISIIPGTNLSIGADVIDQSGNSMPSKVTVTIKHANGEKENYEVNSGELLNLNLPTNTPSGELIISAISSDLVSSKGIEIQELEKIDMSLEGPKLIVKNVGNVPYHMPINVTIGNEIETINVKLAIDETKEFNLHAPSGEYDVAIGNGENEVSGSVLLTGNAISIKDLTPSGLWDLSLLWILLIIIAGVGGILILRKYSPTKTIKPQKSKMRTIPNPLKRKKEKPTKETSHKHDKMVDLTTNKTGDAHSSLVIKGNKENSSVLAISINNYAKLSNETKEKIKQILKDIGGKKGLVDSRGELALLIYSPVITRTYHNEALAARAGLDLKKILEAHNKKYRDKIEFGIGANSGDLICAKQDGKLNYTSIGTTIPLAKKLSTMENENVLVSDAIHKKILQDAKPKKVGEINGSNYYSISTFRNKAANEAKLKELLKRMD